MSQLQTPSEIVLSHSELGPLAQTPLGRFRHYKGGEYEVFCMARHSETEEELVVYRQLDKNTGWWVRPRAMFFETVVHAGKVCQRFALIEAADSVTPGQP